MALPLLPGYTFNRNMGKDKYHKSHYFDSKNEVNFMFGNDKIGIGGEPLPGQRIDAPTSKYPSGEGNKVPAWIAFDKQVLFFDAFFRETVNERREEQHRVRNCRIIFYLEDDTIQVIEPRTRNSCLPQGTIIRRHRIHRPAPNDHLFYTVHDFNVGINIEFYGRSFRIVSCDEFTHNFLRKLGVKVGQPEQVPMDNYNLTRKAMSEAMQPLRPYERKDKLQQFLDHDRHVLRFYCYWDDTDSLYGDRREMVLHYFLADDTVEIREVIPLNAGRDAVPTFLRRQRLAKHTTALPQAGAVADRTILNVLGHPQRGGRYMIDSLKTGEQNTEYYTDADFRIGGVVNVYGRQFVITDMDKFTREYFNTKFGVADFTPISTNKSKGETIEQENQPYNGWGSEEDSLANCSGIMPQPPKRDFMKFMEKDKTGLESNILRFKARFVTDKSLDKDRRFIISYHLADDTLQVYEQQGKNTGFLGGKFLERGRVKCPGQERYNTETPKYYKAQDIYIGSIIEINNFNFFIEDADEYAYRYMEKNADEFPYSNMERIMLKLRNKILPEEERFKKRIQELNAEGNKDNIMLSFSDLCQIMREFFSESELLDHEICTIARFYANRPAKEINLTALVGAAQQHLRKVNFDEFQPMKERIALINRRDDGYIPRKEMEGVFKVFHLPLGVDIIQMLLDVCQQPDNSDLINVDQLLGYLNWRQEPYPAPVSESEIYVDQSNFAKGKCVEQINVDVLAAHVFES